MSNRAVIYARVSSREQEEEGYSLDAQTALIRSYAEKHGFEVVKAFAVAESAQATGRKEFERVLGYLRANPGCVLVVEKVDRLTRNLVDAVDVTRIGAHIHFVKEGLILDDMTSSHDRFIWIMKVGMAAYFVDNHREEVNKGMDFKANLGHFPTRAPLGYLNARDTTKSIIVPDPVMRPLVRRLFEEVALECLSVEAAREFATKIGLVTKRGNRLSTASIHRILRSEFYIGYFLWRGQTYEGKHEPTIDRRTFDRVQAVLDGRSGRTGEYGSRQFAFRGLLKCACCGRTYSPELKTGRGGRGRYVYYSCKNKDCQTRGGHREEVIADLAASELDRIKLPDAIISATVRALKESFEEERARTDQSAAAFRDIADRAKKRLDRLYFDKLDGDIDADAYRSIRDRLTSDIREAEGRLAELTGQRADYFDAGVRFLEIAQRAGELFRGGLPTDQRDILKSVADHFVFDGTKLETVWRQPFQSMLDLANLEPEDLEGVSKKEEWYS